MPKLKEVLEKENAPRLSPGAKRTVRLEKMGAFIRAYDRSAWLLKRYGSPLNVGLDTSDGGAHVFVGFPVASIEKFTPERCETVKDGEGIPEEWIFPATDFPPEGDYDLLDEEYNKWLSETVSSLQTEQEERKAQKKESRREKRVQGRETDKDDTPYIEGVSARPLRLTDVARQVLGYRLDMHSPDECVKFIRELQGELLDLL